MKTGLITKISLFITVLLSLLFAPMGVLAEGENESVVLFVEEGCPYCEKVKGFISDKGLEGIEILDIREDPSNADYYSKVCDEAGIDILERGVPLLYDSGQIINSADQIISYLGEKYNVSTEGYEFENDDTAKNRSVKIVLLILGLGLGVSVLFLLLARKKDK
ncbi:glutathione S-transferase N-terminal domain-containing protein [Candidatus Dojkabacteria bacterium]|nr:glutathione S-transferase N-terminal domain-containing protein [Candidatus Dojkabacteria bacterium]